MPVLSQCHTMDRMRVETARFPEGLLELNAACIYPAG